MKNFTSILVTCLLISTTSFSQAGSLDSSFSQDGIVEARFEGHSIGYSVAIQPDGKIIVAGETNTGHHKDFGLARYLPHGTLDSSFGVNGIMVTDFGNEDHAYSVAIQADGKIVVAGSRRIVRHTDFAIARYTQDGKPDNAFGEDGKVTTDFGPGGSVGYSVAIQSNGKIVVAGYTYNESNYQFALARYKQDGQLDKTFGTKGKLITDFGPGSDMAYSVAIQRDGKILVAGDTFNGSTWYDFALARYKSNGGLDSAFGTNGKVFTDFDIDESEEGHSIAIQADGKIVVAGYTGYPDDFVLARYKPNGSLDSAFGNGGKVITDLGTSFDFARSVAIQADGKIVVAGDLYNDFALVRYRHDGRLDSSFGRRGTVITHLSDDRADCESLAIQTDGKIVVVGYSAYSYVIFRYNGDNTSVSKNDNNHLSEIQKHNNISANIRLSPNPTKDILHIEGLSSSTKTISIIDVKGKLLQQATITNNNYSFNLKQLSAGIYFIRIDEGDKVSTRKFVKE